MAEGHIQVVRAFIEFFRQGQADAALDLLNEHAVLDIARLDPPEGGIAFGHKAIAELTVRYVATFEQYDYEVAKLSDLGGGTVLAVVAERGRGKGSGARVERRYASLYNVIDGQVVRMTHFPTEREALQAAKAPE